MTNPIQELIKRQDEEFEEKFVPLKKGFSELKDWTQELTGTTANYMTLKNFLSQCRQELLDEVVKIGEETLTIDVNKCEWLDNNKKWKDGIEPCIECQNESRIRSFLNNLTKLK